MSTTVDNRVLEMRFDNKQFESGVATSMSTLDKLKQKLNLSGASKGLDGLSSAAKKVNFSGMASGIETVNAKFSAMQVIGMTALANITNSAVNAGKRMVSALTIEPVKTGFQEYETQINAIQTILSNTRQEGTNVEIVNKALDELNTYADKTIYNFTEMTRNIGTFTAAGVKLDTSVNAIKGIANLAAVSGSTSQQASTAMYQLSQALAAGKVQLMDWNSVVNAGMGGKVFQDALIRTSELLGTGAKAAIEAEGSFRESLTKSGWLTTEVLTETLNQLAGAYDKADLMAQGFTESQADEIVALAKDAESAAQDVKTFTQLWDVMKEAAQSGWAQTWRLIVGDFEEAKNILTPLGNFFSDLIGKISDARNKLLESALGKGFTDLADKITNVLEPAKEAATAIADLSEIVDSVIGGNYGNGQDRFSKLAEEGYNWCEVQNKVNETLGCSFRYTEEQISAQDELLGSQKKTTEATEENSEATTKLTDAQKNQIKKLAKMSEEQMRSKGYTEEQIAAMKELGETADKLGIPMDEFIDNLDEINGRWLMLNSFKNIGEALGKVFGALGGAWREVFDPIKPEQIFNAIAAVHKFTASLILNKESAENLQRTFKGLFAALDIVTTIAGGGIKFAFKALSAVLGAFDMNILEVTGNIGDAIYKFRDWLFEQNAVAKALDVLVGKLPGYVGKLKEWFNAFKETSAVDKLVTAIEKIKEAFSNFTSGDIDISALAESLGTNLANALKSIPEIAIQIGKDVIAGFQNGINAGISNSVIGDIISFCTEFIAAFAAALGVQSPSWKTYDIAVDTIQGFINGVKDMIGNALSVVKEFGTKVIEFFKDLPWDKIFAGGLVVSMIWFMKQIADAIKGISSAFEGFGDLCRGAAKVMTSFSKVLNGISWDFKAKAIQKFAISLGILVAAIYVLSNISVSDLTKAVVTIGVLSAVLIGLAFAMDKMSSVNISKNGIEGLKTGLIQIGIALLLLATTVKMIGSMDIDQATQGFVGLAGLAVGMIAFLAAMGGISRYTKDVSQIGSMMVKLSVAMMLMVGVIKLVSGLSAEEMLQGAVFAAAFALFVNTITKVAKDSGGNVSKVGGMILKLSVAMMLMVGVVKLAGMLSAEEMLKGAAFAAAFVLFVKALISVTTIGNDTKLAKIGSLMLAITTSLMLMVGVCKLVGTLSVGEIAKGIAFVSAFVIMIKVLINVTTIGSEQQMAKVSATILAMSVAIGILAAVSIVLSLMDLGGLAKGVAAVTMLGAVMTAMIWATRGANDVKGNLMAMSAAIAVMAAAVVALSFVDGSKLAGATAAISIMMAMFALIAKSSGTMGKVMGPLAVMIVAVGALASVLYLLSSLEVDSTLEVAASLSLLMMTLAVSMQMISKTGGLALSAIAPMAGLVAVLALIAVVLGVMEHFNVEPSIETATSLSILLAAMTGVTVVLSTLGANVAGAAMGVASLAIVVAGIGSIIVALGALNDKFPQVEKFLNEGIPILQKIGEGIGKFVGGIIGGVGEGISGSLPQMGQDIADFMDKLALASDNAAGIDSASFDGVKGLIEAMTGIGLTTVGTTFADIFTLGGTSMEKFQTDGVAFFNAMKEISAAATGVTVDESSFDSVVKAASKLSKLQNSLEPIGGVVSWFSGRDDLATFGVNIGQFMDSMATAFSSLDDITINEEALGPIITAATKLSELQSSLEPIGGVISWFTGRDDLATFGVNIGQFMSSMTTAFSNLDGVTINEEALSSVITASSKLSELQSSLEPIGGVISWFTGRDDLATFGVNIGQFMSSMSTAFSNLGDTSINEETLASVITAATKLSELQSSLEPMGGVISWFSGRSDLGTFGTNVGLFGDAIGKLKTGIGEDGMTEAAITSITNAGNAIIALQQALPEEGWFDGKMNLTEFSTYITDFSTAMSEFSANASEINTEGINTTITAANRIRYLIESLAGLDTSGVAQFAGVGMGDGDVVNIGQSIAKYSEAVADINTAAVSTSVSAALSLKTLIAGLAGLDTSGIENFKVGSIGTAMKSYSDKVSSIDPSIVSSSISSANRLKNFIASLAGLDSSGISNFKVGSIGSTLQSYASSVSGFDAGAVSSSISAANKLKIFIASLSGLDTGGVGSFVSAINKLGTVSIDGIVKSFSGASSKMLSAGSNLIESVANGMKSKQSGVTNTATTIISAAHKAITSKASLFTTAGSTLMTSLASGISSKASSVVQAVSSAVSSAANAVSVHSGTFYTGGVNLGQGLVSGISSMRSAAYQAGYALGQAAAQGEKDGQKSNSPSKLTIQAGKWLGEGLIIGIDKMGSKVYKAGYNLGDSATRSMSKSIAKVSDLINSDVDSQPTIRPVVDLSNVKSSAGAINSMFGMTPSVGVLSNVGTINTMMNRRIQNGNTNEVVSAIDKLRKDLGNVGGTSYNINGITYDDGSAVSDAIKTIIRAANIERRV